MKIRIPQFAFALSILFVFFGSNRTFASHVTGSDFTYKCTSTPGLYEITARVYRDCAGVPLCSNCPTSLSPSCTIQLTVGGTGAFSGISFFNFLLVVETSTLVFDPIQLCNLNKTICNNCGTRTPGSFSPGMEVYTFKGTVDIGSLPTSLCMVKFSFSNCCRNSAIQTISNPSSVYNVNEFYINRCASPCNNSPAFSDYPVIVMCAGVDQNINLSANDPDGDSISYHLAPSLGYGGAIVPYSNPFNQNIPFPYLGYPNQLPLPEGIHLNPTTGDLRFRPIGPFVSNLVIELKQWKYINNVATQTGSVRKDYQIYTTLCSANSQVGILKYDSLGNPNGALGYEQDSIFIIGGKQYCQTFVASDSAQTDTTDFKLTTLTSLPGATVTRLFNLATRSVNGPRQDSIKFCWTPSSAHIRSYPYVFTLRASDRACPLPFRAHKSLAIFVIQDPNKLKITNVNVTNLKCQNIGKGSVIVNAVNGGSPIQYKLNNGVFVDSNSFQNLALGTHKVYAKDTLGFIDSATFAVQNPSTPKVILSVQSKTSTVCKFDSNGTATLTAMYGTAPYKFKILGKNFQDSTLFTGLTGGQKVFIVSDSNSCGDTLNVIISEPSVQLSGSVTVGNPECYGSTGAFILNSSGGIPPHRYSIDSGATYSIVTQYSNVVPRQYQYRLKDANNCIKIYNFAVVSPSQITATSISTNVSCFGGNNGTIQLNVSGGTPPYLYAKTPGNPFQSGNVFYNLTAGLYNVQIKDAKNCSLTKPTTVIGPTTAITTSIINSDETCLGAKNAWALCSASGGAAPYNFTWSSIPIQTTALANNLGSGKIMVSVKDSFKCTVKDSVQIGFRELYQGDNICKVSTDTVIGAHQIIWNKTLDKGISGYKIYGSPDTSFGFTAIGNVSILAEPIFIDTEVSHINKTYYYQIKAIDSCNHESDVVGTHSNAFLSGFKVNVKNELNWLLPIGASGIQNILVWRRNGSMPYVQIANLPSNATQYPDTLMPLNDTSSYMIEFVQTPQCNLQNGVYGKFYSNVIRLEGLPPTGLIESLANSYFAIFPNPSAGIFTISSKQTSKTIRQVEVYNTLGAKVYTNKYVGGGVNGGGANGSGTANGSPVSANPTSGNSQVEINLSDLASGVYYIDIFAQDNSKTSHKITIVR